MPKNAITKSTPRRATKATTREAADPRKGKGSHTQPAKCRTRGDEVMALLRRKNGATIAEMVTRFAIQPHSLRAIISVESRRRGLNVELVGTAHYRII